jgi:DNA-binding NarL/FixJ family response regulator
MSKAETSNEVVDNDMTAIRVMIVEDDTRFREAFADAITRTGDMQLCGSAGDCAGGFELLRQQPDVMLVDLELPDGSGMELIREAARTLPQCDVVVVTIFGDEQHVLSSIEAGATGYLLKDLPAEQLVEQIRVLRAGGSPISPIIARQLLIRFAGQGAAATQPPLPTGEERPTLSEQETNVLGLAAKGYSYEEIAQLLQLSRHTVQTYVKRIYRKLQVNSKVEALSEARRLSLIERF